MSDIPSTHDANAHGPDWQADLLNAVWSQHKDLLEDRLRTIERATKALAQDRLDVDLRRNAERAAHTLAGSLGMFGFEDASRAAHDLELVLEFTHPTRDRAAALSGLLSRVREGTQGPVHRI